MTPEINVESGSVVLPYDRFTLTFNELDMIVTAGVAERVECARASGVEVGKAPASIANSIYESEAYFGPWTLEQARRFGFVEPATDADLVANGITGAPTTSESDSQTRPPFADLSDADSEIVEGCDGPDGELFTAVQIQDGPWVQAMRSVKDRIEARDIPEARDLVVELVECYESEGLASSGDDLPWFPRGANGTRIDAEQIGLARTVVDCKNSIEFTEKMAAIEAREQAVVIEEYADELVAERQMLDEALTKARAVLERHHLLADE